MKTARIDWIDTAKGFVIILMVLGHSSIPPTIHNWIYSFHMPFFFFISGMLIKNTTPSTFNAFCHDMHIFIKRKSKSLLQPFLIYSLINIAIYPIYGEQNLFTFIKGILTEGWGGYALWFIPVFFIANILCIVFTKTKAISYIIIIVMLLIGCSLDYYNINLPWNLASVPFSCAFIILGNLFRNKIIKILGFKKIYLILLLLTFISISFIMSQNYRLDMCNNKILPVLPITICAMSGIIANIIVSKYMTRIKLCSSILQYTGKHTFEILAFSQAIILIINANFTINFVYKYLLLTFLLLIICYIKDYANKYKSIVK